MEKLNFRYNKSYSYIFIHVASPGWLLANMQEKNWWKCVKWRVGAQSVQGKSSRGELCPMVWALLSRPQICLHPQRPASSRDNHMAKSQCKKTNNSPSFHLSSNLCLCNSPLQLAWYFIFFTLLFVDLNSYIYQCWSVNGDNCSI